jgi:uncharacterized membrane protein YukC
VWGTCCRASLCEQEQQEQQKIDLIKHAFAILHPVGSVMVVVAVPVVVSGWYDAVTAAKKHNERIERGTKCSRYTSLSYLLFCA